MKPERSLKRTEFMPFYAGLIWVYLVPIFGFFMKVPQALSGLGGLGCVSAGLYWALVKGFYLSYHHGDLLVNNMVSLFWYLKLKPLTQNPKP